MAKILVPIDPRQSMDLNNDGRVTVDELVHSALYIFVALFVILGAVIVGGWVLITERLPPWRVWALIFILDGLLTGGLIIWRMTGHERREREAAEDRARQHEREDWEFDQARGVSDDARSTTLSQAQIDAAVWQILARYYAGKEWTRDACEKAGVMSAELWNEANALLKKRHIRRGSKRALEHDTLEEAWGVYCAAKLKANQHRMGSAKADWTEAA